MIKLIVADDHPIFRDGLVKSIAETGDFEIVGIAASAQEAVELAAKFKPDVALLDLSMPGNGITAAARIVEAQTAKYVAMLTVSEDDADVTAAFQAGAIGYVLKGVSAEDLRRILKGIARGDAHVSPGLAAQVLKIMQSPKKVDQNPIDDLTKREEQILRLVATGQSNREVADQLNLQEKTVKHYMTTILGKLHARNRVEAALIAHEAWNR
ncbi:response regulator [Litoreibacter janthinus]|uniref:Two component transcriptional regulator, LuxR family n=1 Tax=Litoreibacter janthinus TaxID=670154 RepID=A0A1I6FRI6_9RHOB|nr:response regulator transcription factor [Litoreibacter janthinus]SFR32572.1 two component transcriptional regulator, LuxR family [Litoreibacter janthinus]